MMFECGSPDPFVEHVDRFALARTIDAADQDDNGKFTFFTQFKLRVEQPGAQFWLLGAKGFLGNLVPQLCRFKHDLLPL